VGAQNFLDTALENVLGNEELLRPLLGHPEKHQSYEINILESKEKLDGGL
jgi:hypothetical protein